MITPRSRSRSNVVSGEDARPAAIVNPSLSTDFVGREKELIELRRMLADPDCRLLTLVGPGGSGKTRLAIEAARSATLDLADGAQFVSLQPVTSDEFVVPAIAAALGFSFHGQEEPQVQLFDYLSDKRLLLVLDNFEHLTGASGLLSQMLSAGPQLKLMVTTREALKLSEEWVFPVPGMCFPEAPGVDDPEGYDAVRLFVERARRVKRAYSPDGDWGAIIRLCRLVQGIPLALELAASWMHVMSCDEIVTEIERTLDFLGTRMRNVPERHRSVRAVFEESWSLLSDHERDAFMRLSVFRGTFRREAAHEVAGAGLPLLATLVDKSLLRPLPGSRYQVHELLRGYAFEKLTTTPEAVARANDAHSAYYLAFVREREPDLVGGQREASAKIEVELDNIRAALQWATDHGRTERLVETVNVLGRCWQFKSRYVEAATVLEGVVRSLEQQKGTNELALALGRVLVELAWFYIRLGRLSGAESVLKRSRRIYEELRASPAPGFATDPRQGLGVVATIRGAYAEAARLGEESLAAAESQGNPWNREISYYVLSRARLLQGDVAAARTYAQQACDTATQAGDRWFLAYPLIELGNIASALGDPAAAKAYFQSSYDLRREFEDPEGMAIALTCLGQVAAQAGSFAEAQDLYEQAIVIYQDIHDKGGLAAALAGLANAAVAGDDYEAAKKHFVRALHLAADIQHVPQILSLMLRVGEMLFRRGDEAAGLELLTFALHHPASNHETRLGTQRALEGRRDRRVTTAAQGGATANPRRATSVLQEALSMTTDPGIRALLERAGGAAGSSRTRSFPDELTEREVEVLRLVAGGRSNRQIAGELFITENTVANHVKNILSKTQSANRTEAAAYAIEKKLS